MAPQVVIVPDGAAAARLYSARVMPVLARIMRETDVHAASRGSAMLGPFSLCVFSAIVAIVGAPSTLLLEYVESLVFILGLSLWVKLALTDAIFSISISEGGVLGLFSAHATENGWLENSAKAGR